VTGGFLLHLQVVCLPILVIGVELFIGCYADKKVLPLTAYGKTSQWKKKPVIADRLCLRKD
jgi:hypothetical protein